MARPTSQPPARGALQRVAFHLKPGVREDDFLAASEEISRWAACQRGFEYRCLVRGEDGRWQDLRFWSDAGAAERAEAKLAQDKAGCLFLRMIDPQTVETLCSPVLARKAPAGLMLAA